MWLTRISVPPLTLIEFFLQRSRAISGADLKKLSIKLPAGFGGRRIEGVLHLRPWAVPCDCSRVYCDARTDVTLAIAEQRLHAVRSRVPRRTAAHCPCDLHGTQAVHRLWWTTA